MPRSKIQPAPPNTLTVVTTKDPFDVYGGRAALKDPRDCTPGIDTGWLGNPHKVGKCDCAAEHHNRSEAISHFRIYFEYRVRQDAKFRRAVLALRGKRVACFCKPKPCHLDVVREWLEANPK